jgi:NleD-like pathogen effector protein (putative zinc metallopeptidase)
MLTRHARRLARLRERRPEEQPEADPAQDAGLAAQADASPAPHGAVISSSGGAPLSRQVAAAVGNRAFTGLVALAQRQHPGLMRQEGATATPAARESTTAATAPAGPQTVITDHGTFAVYPDDFVGPLPVAEAGAGHAWPVRQADYARIHVAMESVEGGAAGVTVEGSDAFKSAVLLDLAWLLTQSVGQELVESIVGTGRTLTLKASGGGNTTAYASNDDSYEREDGTPGPGSDTTVSYDIGEWNPYGGTEAWMRRPPAIGLAHEMVHAWTGMSGTRARGSTDGVNRRELQATGLGEFSGAALTENRFRAAFGLQPRPRY